MRVRPGTRLLPRLVGKQYEVEPALPAQHFEPFGARPSKESDKGHDNGNVPDKTNSSSVRQLPDRVNWLERLSQRTIRPSIPYPEYAYSIGKLNHSLYATVPAAFWRGGTSNGVLLQYDQLPRKYRPGGFDALSSNPSHYADTLQPFFAALMGSPDPWGRQLNGMGGGISSLSKALIVQRVPARLYDFEYTFIQIGVKDGKLDMEGNCGNMTSAVVPFAINRQLLRDETIRTAAGRVRYLTGIGDLACDNTRSMSINIRNTNTNKIVQVEFEVCRESGRWFFQPSGTASIDGIPGTASPILLSFLDPAGSKTGELFPTGNPTDSLELADGIVIKASLVDCSNPGIFVDGWSVGMEGLVSTDELLANTTLLHRLEEIRQAGASRMGLDPTVPSIPKVVVVFPAYDSDADIACMALSMGQPHKAVPVTLALNLGVACRLPGTIPYALARRRNTGMTTIAHPAGNIEVGADIQDGKVLSAKLLRTARCLMEGYVNASVDHDVEEIPHLEYRAGPARVVRSRSRFAEPFAWGRM